MYCVRDNVNFVCIHMTPANLERRVHCRLNRPCLCCLAFFQFQHIPGAFVEKVLCFLLLFPVRIFSNRVGCVLLGNIFNTGLLAYFN